MNELLRKLQKLKPAGKIGVTLGALLAISLLYYQFFYSDLADGLTSAKAHAGELESELASYKVRKNEYLGYRVELNQLMEEQRDLMRALPKKAEIPSFISNIQEQAELAALEVLTIEITAEVPQDLYVKIPVKMEIRGTYHQIAKFFRRISEMRRIVNVENLVIAPDADGRAPGTLDFAAGGPPKLRAKFLASTFRFKDAATTTAVAPGGTP